MKPFPVRFEKKQHLQVADLMEKTMASQTQVARAAMQIGLKALREEACNDPVKALHRIMIEESKALN